MIMTETDCLNKMVAPSQRRPNVYYGGVLQIHVTRGCNLKCFNCTQLSQLRGPVSAISVNQFEDAVASLECTAEGGYFGVVGVFGGSPTLHKKFDELCLLMQKYVPFERRGLWTNNLHGWGQVCRETFNPGVSNLNVHLDKKAYDEFKRDWPESLPFGLDNDSRHSPPWVAMKDLDILPGGKENTETNRLELISRCDINQNWSAMISVFRGELRAYFCEIAGAMSMIHQEDTSWPDTGLEVKAGWWRRSMSDYRDQVRVHCHACGVPLRGIGSLAILGDKEQVSVTHSGVYKPKDGRVVEVVSRLDQLGSQLEVMTDYLGNADASST